MENILMSQMQGVLKSKAKRFLDQLKGAQEKTIHKSVVMMPLAIFLMVSLC